MNLISHVQSMLRLQLKINIVQMYAAAVLWTIGTETSGSQVHIFASGIWTSKAWYPKPLFSSHTFFYTLVMSYTHCLKNNQKSINAYLFSFVTSPKAIRLMGK